MQGIWSFGIIQTRGWPKPIGKGPDKFGQGDERRWLIKGNTITWTSPAGEEVQLTFTIDTTQSPKHFDVEFVSGPHAGKKCQGIYERGGLSGKMLWLCLVDPTSKSARPTTFGMSSESGHTLIGLEPAQPEAGRTEFGTGEAPHFNRLPPGPTSNPNDSTLQQKQTAPVTSVATKPGSYDIKPGLKLANSSRRILVEVFLKRPLDQNFLRCIDKTKAPPSYCSHDLRLPGSLDWHDCFHLLDRHVASVVWAFIHNGHRRRTDCIHVRCHLSNSLSIWLCHLQSSLTR